MCQTLTVDGEDKGAHEEETKTNGNGWRKLDTGNQNLIQSPN